MILLPFYQPLSIATQTTGPTKIKKNKAICCTKFLYWLPSLKPFPTSQHHRDPTSDYFQEAMFIPPPPCRSEDKYVYSTERNQQKVISTPESYQKKPR